jgi:hypothetical protein
MVTQVSVEPGRCSWGMVHLDSGARPYRLIHEQPTPSLIPPLPPGEGGVRAKQSQGKRFRFLDCHTLICKLL